MQPVPFAPAKVGTLDCVARKTTRPISMKPKKPGTEMVSIVIATPMTNSTLAGARPTVRETNTVPMAAHPQLLLWVVHVNVLRRTLVLAVKPVLALVSS